MSSFRTQHPVFNAFDRSAMSVARIAPAGEIASSGLAALSSIVPTTLHKDSAMRHSHTSRGLRTSAKTILAFIGLGFAGACSDSISAPTRDVSHKVPAAYTVVLGVTSFRYNSAYPLVQRFDDHVLVIPAGGICDPATSSYGSAFWDAECSPLTGSLTITATTYADPEGHPYVDFQPALRFVPTKETNLYLKDGKRDAQTVTINYCNALGVCIDESANDPSLATHRIGKSRVLVRRIKHFSGYHVAAGQACEGTIIMDPEGGLWCDTDGSGLPRSGYMLLSGLGKKKPGETKVDDRHKKIDE